MTAGRPIDRGIGGCRRIVAVLGVMIVLVLVYQKGRVDPIQGGYGSHTQRRR